MNKKSLSAAIGCLMAGGMMAQAPVNDDCATAIDINSLFGGALNTAVVGGPYTNTNGTQQMILLMDGLAMANLMAQELLRN